jgi:tRNA wybutosine-synthesizing protein 4
MLAHFEKMQAKLQSVDKYPETSKQEKRFLDAGWGSARARNLWELWGSSDFLTSSERIALDEVEPFDEWEEFALFACHYFLLVARSQPIANAPDPGPPHLEPSSEQLSKSLKFVECAPDQEYRRFAAPIPLNSQVGGKVGCFGGMGQNIRLKSIDVYPPDGETGRRNISPSVGPESRMCHTITDLGNGTALLVGGRASPDKAMADCWLYHSHTGVWERVADLPEPRYRHCAVAVNQGNVMIAGGKSHSRSILTDFLVWSYESGWKTCKIENGDDESPSLFGAIMATTGEENVEAGFIAGGMQHDGLVSQHIWSWRLEGSSATVCCNSPSDNPY